MWSGNCVHVEMGWYGLEKYGLRQKNNDKLDEEFFPILWEKN